MEYDSSHHAQEPGQQPPNAPPSTQNPPPDPQTQQHSQLFATGFNGYSQLSATRTTDLSSFIAITAPSPTPVRLLHPTWSSTVLQLGTQIATLGHQRSPGREIIDLDASAGELSDAVGDHEGMLACVDSAGRLWVEGANGLGCLADAEEGSPLVGHLAMASNGRVAMTFKQAPNGRLCHVLCFDSLGELRDWYCNPSEVKYDAEKQHFMMQGQPRELLAGTGTFLLRMESGEVYSWGDARYSSLGRSIADAPAERPGPIEALGGLKIKKIACGGWLNAALSEDGACYLWGAGAPGTDQTIRCLREAGAGEVVLVELSFERGTEPLDILDVAVGDNYIVLLAEGNLCFAAGENRNGQLGLGHFDHFVDDWTQIPLGASRVYSVVCGPKSTYAFAASNS